MGYLLIQVSRCDDDGDPRMLDLGGAKLVESL
jgi:hypothetical protein